MSGRVIRKTVEGIPPEVVTPVEERIEGEADVIWEGQQIAEEIIAGKRQTADGPRLLTLSEQRVLALSVVALLTEHSAREERLREFAVHKYDCKLVGGCTCGWSAVRDELFPATEPAQPEVRDIPREAAAFNAVCTDDSENEPPDFEVADGADE